MAGERPDARRAIEDLELDKRLASAGAAATKLAQQAVGRAGSFADDHREQAHGLLGRAETEVDRVTGGRASDLIGTIRSGLAAGVDLVADQHPDRADGAGPDASAGQAAEPSADEDPSSPPSPQG